MGVSYERGTLVILDVLGRLRYGDVPFKTTDQIHEKMDEEEEEAEEMLNRNSTEVVPSS